MKINLEKQMIEFNDDVFISYWSTLPELWKGKQYNWNTFTLIQVEIENDFAMHGQEITLAFLCCGIRLRWQTHPKKEHKIHEEVRKAVEDIKSREMN